MVRCVDITFPAVLQRLRHKPVPTTELIYIKAQRALTAPRSGRDEHMMDGQSGGEVRVPELSILYRVRRRLKPAGQTVYRTAPDSIKRRELGRYFIADTSTRSVIERDIDLVELARRLGALRASESVERAA